MAPWRRLAWSTPEPSMSARLCELIEKAPTPACLREGLSLLSSKWGEAALARSLDWMAPTGQRTIQEASACALALRADRFGCEHGHQQTYWRLHAMMDCGADPWAGGERGSALSFAMTARTWAFESPEKALLDDAVALMLSRCALACDEAWVAQIAKGWPSSAPAIEREFALRQKRELSLSSAVQAAPKERPRL